MNLISDSPKYFGHTIGGKINNDCSPSTYQQTPTWRAPNVVSIHPIPYLNVNLSFLHKPKRSLGAFKLLFFDNLYENICWIDLGVNLKNFHLAFFNYTMNKVSMCVNILRLTSWWMFMCHENHTMNVTK